MTDDNKFKWLSVEPIKGEQGYVSKGYDVDADGKLTKLPTKFPQFAMAKIEQADSFEGFVDYVNQRKTDNWYMLHGLPSGNGDRFVMTSEEGLKNREAKAHLQHFHKDLAKLRFVARSNNRLRYPSGPRLCAFDTDPTDVQRAAGKVPTLEQIIDDLEFAFPEFRGAPYGQIYSNSSFIFVGDEMIQGPRGVRTIFPIQMHDVATNDELREWAKAGHHRLIADGRYSYAIGANGVVHLKTAVDVAIYTMSQPDFLGAPYFRSEQVSQRRPDMTLVEASHGGFDPVRIERDWLRDTPEVLARVAEAKRQLQEEHAVVIREIKVRRRDQRADKMQAVDPSLTRAQALKAADRLAMADAGETKDLPLELVIYMDSGRVVTCGEILCNPLAFKDQSCAAPLEPEYGADDGEIGRHKAKVRMDTFGRMFIMDYAHGAFERRYIVDHRPFEAVLAAADGVVAATSGLAAPLGAAEVTSTLAAPLQPSQVQPVPAYALTPITDVAEAHVDTVRALAAVLHADGVNLAAGTELGLNLIRAFLRQKRGTIFVATYEEAARLKAWMARFAPDRVVMVMPSRTVDPDKLRQTHGVDFLGYSDEFGDGQGLDDTICFKRLAVIALHDDAGLSTSFGHACEREVDDQVLQCAHYATCGRNLRTKAKVFADVVIEVIGAAKGASNPMVEESGRGADMLFAGVASATTADVLVWEWDEWDAEPLRQFRDHIMAGGDAKAYHNRWPEGAKAALIAWAGLPSTDPRWDNGQLLTAVRNYRAGQRSSGWKHEHSKLVTFDALDRWVHGKAEFQISGKLIRCMQYAPLTRLEEATSVLAVDSHLSAAMHLSRLSDGLAGVMDAPQVHVSANASRMPSRVVQYVPTMEQDNPASWLRKNEGDLSMKITPGVRKILATIREQVEAKGAGMVVSASCARIRIELEKIGVDVSHIRFVDFVDVTIAALGAGELDFSGTWCICVGRLWIDQDHLRAIVLSSRREDWPPEVLVRDGAMWQSSEPLFVGRDGKPIEPPAGTLWSWRGCGEVLDRAHSAAVLAPFQLIAEAMAMAEGSDGVDRTLLVFVPFPLSYRGEGVFVDEVLPLGSINELQALRAEGMNVTNAAKFWGMSRDYAYKNGLA